MQIFVLEENRMVLLGLHIQCQIGDIRADIETYPCTTLENEMNHSDAYFKCKTIKENFLKDQLHHYHVNRI